MKLDETSSQVRRVIADNVRVLREKTGQSQMQFAEMVGVNRPYLNQIENAKANASIDILVKIANGLDVPLTDLLKGLEVAPPHRLPKDTEYAVVSVPKRKRS